MNKSAKSETKLFNEETFDKTSGPPGVWGENVFMFCEFVGLSINGGNFSGAYLGCAFLECEEYWGMFNGAVVSQTAFENCMFRGTSFRGCHFTACTFTNCRFELDNLGGECTIEGCTFTECAFNACVIKHDSLSGRPVFENARFYKCTQKLCQGLEVQF